MEWRHRSRYGAFSFARRAEGMTPVKKAQLVAKGKDDDRSSHGDRPPKPIRTNAPFRRGQANICFRHKISFLSSVGLLIPMGVDRSHGDFAFMVPRGRSQSRPLILPPGPRSQSKSKNHGRGTLKLGDMLSLSDLELEAPQANPMQIARGESTPYRLKDPR